jgi:hypothetical protein
MINDLITKLVDWRDEDHEDHLSLSRNEVCLLLDEIARLRGGTVAVPVYSFSEMKEEAKRTRSERLRRVGEREPPPFQHDPKDKV